MPYHSLKAQAMYRKFEFAAQPFFKRNPAVIHPDFELIFSGVMEIDIEGERELLEVYINGVEYKPYPSDSKKTSWNDYHKFRHWINNRLIDCDDSDEAQAKITLPPGNMYDEAYKKKPSGNARWFDPSELTAESAAEFAAIIGEVDTVGETLVTEFSHQKIN